MVQSELLNCVSAQSHLLDGIGVGVALVDASIDRILFANKALCRLTKYRHKELEASVTSFAELIHPEDRSRVAPHLERLLDGQIDQYKSTKRYVRSDGSFVWVRATATMLSDRSVGGRLIVRAIEQVADSGFEETRPKAGSFCGPAPIRDFTIPAPAGENDVGSRTAASYPHYARRAVEFMNERRDGTCSITEIAAHSGVSARTLQRYFSSQGMSLKRFAKRIRLQRVREVLLRHYCGQTVTAVAFACGFSNLGHFARDYQAAFGELPSETLAGTTSKRHDGYCSDQSDKFDVADIKRPD
jgi:PAS domain S-box-containing protein